MRRFSQLKVSQLRVSQPRASQLREIRLVSSNRPEMKFKKTKQRLTLMGITQLMMKMSMLRKRETETAKINK